MMMRSAHSNAKGYQRQEAAIAEKAGDLSFANISLILAYHQSENHRPKREKTNDKASGCLRNM